MYQSNQNGRSMIEMLGVLAVIGILTTGGFNLVMKTRMHQAINETTDTITSLASKVRHIIRDYQLDNPSAAANTSMKDYVITANAYPDSLTDTDWTDRNDVTYDVIYVGTTPVFWVTATGLSEEMCLHLSNGNYGTNASSGFIGLTYTSTGDTCTNTKSAPVPLSVAVTCCSPTTNPTGAMKFGFR